MRTVTALFLAVLIAAPPVSVGSAPASGTVQGVVTVAGRPVSGLVLALVDLNSGAVHKTKSGEGGTFKMQIAPGEYVITSGSQAGLAVGRGPTRLSVAPGQMASADLDLVALPVVVPQDPKPAPADAPAAGGQEPPAASTPLPEPALTQAQIPDTAPTATTINHDAIGCFIAGEFPLIEAGIQPASSVARARVYFRAAQGGDWFFVEMTSQEGQFSGKLPRPKIEASPISYYVQATTTEFGEAQTPENAAIVVPEASQCPQDKKVAAIGPPGPVQVFSAASGSIITPAGFAAGGLALTGGIIALAAGAAAVGIGTAIVISNPSPSPSPVPTPTPVRPTPTPPESPSPSPSPSPTPIGSPKPGSFSR